MQAPDAWIGMKVSENNDGTPSELRTDLGELLESVHVTTRCFPVGRSQSEESQVDEKENDEENDVCAQRADQVHEDNDAHEDEEVSY